jgi:hypothetical protein
LVWHLISEPADEEVTVDNLPGDENAVEKADPFELTIANLSKAATSPIEGLLAAGTDMGSVTVWFCSPAVDTVRAKPREMLNLRGHMGAKITTLAFDPTGTSLVTADENHRNFAWHSKPANR